MIRPGDISEANPPYSRGPLPKCLTGESSGFRNRSPPSQARIVNRIFPVRQKADRNIKQWIKF